MCIIKEMQTFYVQVNFGTLLSIIKFIVSFESHEKLFRTPDKNNFH